MGTDIPPIIIVPPGPPGDQCPFCWGLGKTFGPGLTPLEMTVSFSGINVKPGRVDDDGEPFNGVYTVTQLPGAPCQSGGVPPVG